MNYLFTYGTLMNGQCRNYILHYFGFHYRKDIRISGYSIMDYPTGKFPVMFPGSDADTVTGEVWEFPNASEDLVEQILEMLDMVEGEGSLYKREIVNVSNSLNVIAYVGISDAWQDVKLADALLDESGKWIAG